MNRIRGFVLTTALLAGALGCASTGSEGPRRDYRVLTRAEILEMEGQVTNLYDVIQRLRPRWFDVRGSQSFSGSPEIVVYQDQTYLGDPSVLRGIGLDLAMRLTHLDAAEAVAQLPGLGSRRVAGAIVIHTR